MADYTLSNFRNYTTFTDQTGSAIYDSGGPTGSYPAGDNYYFIIAPSYSTGSLIVAVESASFASTDKIRIYDGVPTKGTTGSFSYTGTTINSQLIGILTGTFGTPRYFTASSGRAYVRFSGDTAGTFGGAAGFKLSWTGSNFYTPSFYGSTLVNNQYGVTFPADGTSGSYMTFARGKLSSSSTLDFNKDIIVGFWAKQDTLPASAPEGPVLSVGPYNGGTGFAISRAGSPTPGDNSFRIFYNDISGNISVTTLRATDIVNGGQLSSFTYPPQWNHYGFVIRKTGVNTGEYLTYKDGVLFSTASITKAASWGYITSAYDIVLGSYRDFTTGLVLSGGASKSTWSGSLDDVFLAAATTGSAKTEYSTFFNRIYNSGNWSNPNVEITGALSASLNPVVIFNWRFEETGSMLNTIDYGAYGNLHSASTVGNIANSSVRLTFTSSGVSSTPYASLSYSGSNATITFITSSDSVYENTASYYIGVRASVAAVGQTATASISTSSFGATAFLGTDYNLVYGGTTYSSSAQLPIFVSWPAADTSTKYITASIIDNTTYTGTSSSFSLFINTANSTNVVTGSPGFFTLKILDYEEGYASLQSSSYSTGEASGSVTVYVDRLSGSSGPLSVNYFTTNGTALSGTNYTKITGTLSWVSGNITAQTIVVPITYDNVQTSNLNFTVNLTGLSTGSYSSYPTAITSSTITIADQEPGTFNWSSTTLTAYETGTLATINVNRISGTYGAVTVNISGSSSLGQPLRTTMTGTLSFADGDNSKQFTINIQDDLIDESNDVIYYRLYPTSSTSGATSFTGSSGLLAFTLIDNETGSVTFNTGAASVYENTSSYIFNLQRLYGGDQAETASIYFTSTGASYDIIYNNSIQSSPFNVTWADQDKSTKYITASIYDNQTSGSTKLVSFSIASSSVSAIGPSSSFILSVLDYEEGIPSFNSSSYSVGEASSTVQLSVYRYSGSQGPLSVNYTTVNGTALSGTNYTKTTGTLSWADGNTSVQYINVPITYDGVQTSNLNFTVNLSGLSTGSFSNYPNSVTSSTVTITDQEPGTFKISSSSYSVIEGQSFNVTVSRYSGSFGAVTVNLTSSNGTAVSGTDYTQVNQNLSFANTETTKSFSISTIENNTDVPPPSLYFNFGISSISSAYGTSFKGIPSSAAVYIIDNETGSIKFSSNSYTGSQNSTITIPILRYSGSDFAATASVVKVGGTAVAGVDYADIFPYTVYWADQVSGAVNVSLSTIATGWSSNTTLNLAIQNLTNIASGSIMSASILIQTSILTKSANSYSDTDSKYVIYDYANISNQFTRRIQQVPFSLNIKGTGKIRKP